MSYQPNFIQSLPSDPTGTTSLTFVMMGFAIAFTPTTSGIISVFGLGAAENSNAANGCYYKIMYGTGTAPINGAAVTGSDTGNTNGNGFDRFNAANKLEPFPIEGLASGLIVGTAYWFDVAIKSITAGTATIKNNTISIIEQ